MTTNQEWLFSLTLEEYLKWMESEHSEPKDDASSYGADFKAVEMDASRLVVNEPDSREKLEADVRKHYAYSTTTLMYPPSANKTTDMLRALPVDTVIGWLDRQAAITREEADAGCKECFTETYKREREFGETIDGLTDQVGLERRKAIELTNAINELQKKQPHCYNPEQPLESLNTIGRYIDELKSRNRNLVDDLARASYERDNLKLNNLQLHTLAGEQAATIDELTAERDKLKELNEYHALQYELASEDCDRLQAQVDELQSKLAEYEDRSMQYVSLTGGKFYTGTKALTERIAELTAERDNLEANNQQLHTLAGEQAATIDELTAERDELQTRVYNLRADLSRTDADCEWHREKFDKCDSDATDTIAWKNSKYTITLKQLATIMAKCHGMQLTDKDGYPVVNPLDVDPTEKVELHELITCENCEHWKRFWPETEELYGACQVWYKKPTRYDGWCYKARKKDNGEKHREEIRCGA